MFFQKKKDKTKESTGTVASSLKQKKDRKKGKTEPLSKEEIVRLEETKSRLFPTLGRKKSNVKELSIASKKPDPPPRPRLHKDLPPSTAPPPPPVFPPSKEKFPYYNSGPCSSLDLSQDGDYNDGFHPLKTFNLPSLSLPTLAKSNLAERTLIIRRTEAGDFGFTVRRVQLLEHGQNVLLIESTSCKPLELPSVGQLESSFLPGDQLIEVNGRSVETMNREEIFQLLDDSVGDSVTLLVRPMLELGQLVMRMQQTNSDDSEALFLAPNVLDGRGKPLPTSPDEREERLVWLTHKDGYTLASIANEDGIGVVPEGKVRIRIEQNGVEMVVDSEDVQKTNPSTFDRVSDLAQLAYLNESSVLHLLRQRFGSNLVHTYCGSINSVVLNPGSTQQHQCSSMLNNAQLARCFKGGAREDTPPHSYACAQHVYRLMQSMSPHQSVVFTGSSGAGKSVQMGQFVYYLGLVAGSTCQNPIMDKFSACLTVLEAFGNCRTVLNRNASRFATIFSLQFDNSGQISGANVQGLMLECQRVVVRPENESNFHVFHQLSEGCDPELRKELHLDRIPHSPSSANYSSTTPSTWSHLLAALSTLSITPSEQHTLWTTLSAIMHLSLAEAVPGTRSQFVRMEHAQITGQLLGVSLVDLQTAVFRSIRSGSERLNVTDKQIDGRDALNGFLSGLYGYLFDLMLVLLNRTLDGPASTNWITMVDCPGVQNPADFRPANLSDLLFNYANERIHRIYCQCSFTDLVELYGQEQVDVDVDVDVQESAVGPEAMVELLDRQSQHQLIHSANIELRSREQRGLLWLLDEESAFPGASDESFLERLFVHHVEQKKGPIRRSRQYNRLILRHCLGTNPVTYDVSGWLKHAQDQPSIRTVLPLLQRSAKESLSTLYLLLRPGISSSINRSSSLLKSIDSLKRAGRCISAKLHMDYIAETVTGAGRVHFVHCFIPRANIASGPNEPGVNTGLIDVPLLRRQIRGVQLIEGVRMNKIGYPDRLPFGQFKRRFSCLQPAEQVPLFEEFDHRVAVKNLLESLEIDPDRYRIGISQILLRNDLLVELQSLLHCHLASLIVHLQCHCRSLLARKKLQRLRMQKLAIECIQKNVNKYSAVRSWPWWRLFQRVLPLVQMNNGVGQLQDRDRTIARMGHEAAEMRKECQQSVRGAMQLADCFIVCTLITPLSLRLTNRRLECRLSEVSGDLADEKVRRVEIDRLMQSRREEGADLQAQCQILNGKLAASLNQSASFKLESGDINNANVTDLERQVELLKEERRESEMEKKGFFEKYQCKLSDMNRENAEFRTNCSVLKRKAQKVTEELQDVQLILSKVNSRNSELEKKQKKFDFELKTALDDFRSEKILKERLIREKDESTAKFILLEAEMNEIRNDKRHLETKLDQIRKEFEEISHSAVEGAVDNELVSLRRDRLKMQRKIADQEEELNEMADNMYICEQTITKLQMNSEKSRNERRREVKDKEKELEDLREQHQSMLRTVHLQLEEEMNDKAACLREKRDLEMRLGEAVERRNRRNESTEIESQLRRDLRKATALFKDSQLALSQCRGQSSTRSLVKTLRRQLEDASYGHSDALSGRLSCENEVTELKAELDSQTAARILAEERCVALIRDRNSVHSAWTDADEQGKQLLRKHRAQVQQSSVDLITLSEQLQRIADLEHDKQSLHEQLAELRIQQQWTDSNTIDKHKLHLAERKIKDLEAKLNLELSSRQRLEFLTNKSREEAEGLQTDLETLRIARDREVDNNRRLKKSLSSADEMLVELQKKDVDGSHRLVELERQLETVEQEQETLKSDLKLALRRVEGLQNALQDELFLEAIDEEEEEEVQNEQNTANGEVFSWPSFEPTSTLNNTVSTLPHFESVSSEASDPQPKTSTPKLVNVQ